MDGELRFKAAKTLGLTEVPVILCDEWNPAQVKAFRLMANRSGTWAEWDEALLALELEELSAVEFDLDLTGFDPCEVDRLLAAHSKEDDREQQPEAVGVGDAEKRGCVVSIECYAATAPRLSMWTEFSRVSSRC